MGTAFTDVYDLFQIHIKDWRLDALYTSSPTNWATYLEQFLTLAIYDFDICNQSLASSGTAFTETLTGENKNILAEIMVQKWLEKEVRDVRQMALHVQDRDFKTFAEANNLTAKESSLTRVDEKISQILVDYSYKNGVNWSDWLLGNFWEA